MIARVGGSLVAAASAMALLTLTDLTSLAVSPTIVTPPEKLARLTYCRGAYIDGLFCQRPTIFDSHWRCQKINSSVKPLCASWDMAAIAKKCPDEIQKKGLGPRDDYITLHLDDPNYRFRCSDLAIPTFRFGTGTVF